MATQIATGNDSTGALNVIVLEGNVPYLITQNLDGSWQPAALLPNPNNRQYYYVSAASGVNGELQVILLGEQDGQPYVTQIISGSPTQAPTLLDLAPGTVFTSAMTCYDSGEDLLLVFLLANTEMFPCAER